MTLFYFRMQVLESKQVWPVQCRKYQLFEVPVCTRGSREKIRFIVKDECENGLELTYSPGDDDKVNCLSLFFSVL